MNDLKACYRVIGNRKCGGAVIFRDDLPTCRTKVCKKCGFVYFFIPNFDVENDFHAVYPEPEIQAEGATCKLTGT